MENNKINPFSYWEQSLFQVIKISHPYMLEPEEKEQTKLFIIERAKEAKAVFEKESENSDPISAKEYVRNEVLLAGLMFSPTDFLASFYWEAYEKELSIRQRIDIYQKTKSIFKEFWNNTHASLDDPDNEQALIEKLSRVCTEDFIK